MNRIEPGPFPESGIQTLDRSTLLVELVARAGTRGMTAAELEEASGFSLATIYRLAQALKRLGMLRQLCNRGPYLLGHQLIVWGSAAGQSQQLKRIARAPLEQLAQQFDDSFFLFVPDGFNVLCLDIQDGSHPARSYVTDLGNRIRHGLGQASIAILSQMDAAEYEQVLAQNLPGLMRNYGIHRFEVDQAVAMCRQLGVTGGVEGRQPPEFTGLASSIIGPDGTAVAALSCSLLRSRLTDSHYAALCDGLRQHSLAISQQLNSDADVS